MLSIKVKNIGGLQDINEFKFREGLNIIKAPNASGKSSLINAFKLALNGSDFSTYKKINEFLNDFKDSGSVEININGSSIDLLLDRKKSRNVIVSEYSSTVEFLDDRLLKLIFFDQFSDIYQTIISGDTEKFKDWISNITDIKLYQIALDLVKNKEDVLKNQLLRLTEQDKGKKETLQEQLNSCKNKLNKLKTERNKIVQSSTDIEIQSELQTIIIEYEKTEQQLKENKDSKNNKDQTLIREKEREKNLNTELNEKTKEFESIKIELLEIEGKIEQIDLDLEKLEEENKIYRSELDGTVKEINGKKRTIEGLRNKLKNKIKRMKNQRTLFDYLECPTCYQPLDQKKIRIDIQKLDKEIKELTKEIEDREIKLKENNSKISKLKYERERGTTELPNQKKELEKTIVQLEKELKQLAQKISKIENELPKFKVKIENLEEKYKKIKNKKKDLESNLKKMNTRYTEIDQKIADKKEERNLLEEKLKKFSEETNIIQELKKKVQAANEIKNHFQKIVEIIRNDIIGVINNEILNSFTLLELAELNYLSIDPGTYELEIRRKLGRKTELIELSAAERTLIALIIHYITKRVLLSDVPIFFIDETSNAFDDTRFQKIINYLANEIKILIVTKNEPFKGKRGDIISQKNIVYNF